MVLRKCPQCGQSIKLENMRKHFANVHPGKDPSKAISEEEVRQVRRKSKRKSNALYTRRPFQAVVAIALLVVVGYVGYPYVFPPAPPGPYDFVGSCGAESFAEHYHPLLVINYRTSPSSSWIQEHLPYDSTQSAAIGYIHQPTYTNPSLYCPGSGIHVLHTHDGSGIIHVELPLIPPSPPSLGDFFTIWGQPLSGGAVWSYPGTVTAEMYNLDAHRSTDYSGNPRSIPLYGTTSQYGIPSGLIFGGTYGNGASAGQFSGEIIWLNVTA
ncbi:MAG TPA: hypothetical protein VEM95_04885 [Thermoplasmata archaeon]|nr:hypothetical protein [Thermoplasmata archaeon]